MDVHEYMGYDATGLAELVAQKQVTAAELLELARKRAAEVNDKLNAIVIETANEADAQVAGDLSGPFAGVPFLIKDLMQEYKGYPTTMGSRSLRNYVATENALVTDRFLAAGLVIFGLSALPEGIPRWWGIVAGSVGFVVTLVASGTLRWSWGRVLGWVIQIVIALGALLVPAILLVTIVFDALYAYAMIGGSKIERRVQEQRRESGAV